MTHFPVSGVPVSSELDEAIQTKIDQKTKPLGSLGYLEALAFQISRIQTSLTPELRAPHILVFAADHGIVKHGVSAFPQDVTWQMVLNFLNGGAAINVFARQHEIALKVIDVGVNHQLPERKDLVNAKVAFGTADMTVEKAMSSEVCEKAMLVGKNQVENIWKNGSNVVGFGEMGIGNTSSASLIMSRILELPVSDCVGRGTGLNNTQLQKKISILTKVSEYHQAAKQPQEILESFGGLEIAAMVGAMLEAASKKMVVLVDGFIATSAYLIALKMQPSISDYAVFCHCSNEAGHRLILQHLKAKPILDLGMRLGEGTGCALAYPLLVSAVAMMNEMASFADASVSESQ